MKIMKFIKIILKITLELAFLFGILAGPLLLFSYLDSQGYEMDANAYLYTLSTIPQTIAALIGLFGIFVILKLEDFRKEKNRFRSIDIYSFFLSFVFGIMAIVISLMFLPFSNLKLNEIDFLSSIGESPLKIVGFALGICFGSVILMIHTIYTIIKEESKKLVEDGQYKFD